MFVQSDQGVWMQGFAVALGVSLMIIWSFSLPEAPENPSVALTNNVFPMFQDEAGVTDIKRGTYMV